MARLSDAQRSIAEWTKTADHFQCDIWLGHWGESMTAWKLS
jgi:hypothetical protein